ncbi:MAG: FtsX-like permease family protein [Planctomycetota bacterium]
MYRTFLSWRYLFARTTNLIGMVGILVAVGALILIFSIMTGFLEESRRAVRGNLADILVEPFFDEAYSGIALPTTPERALAVIEAHPGVRAAAPMITWHALFTQGGSQKGRFNKFISDASHSGMLGVKVVGIDVRSAERVAQPAFAGTAALLGMTYRPYVVRDHFAASDLLRALLRPAVKPLPGLSGDEAVAQPLFPFATPAEASDKARRARLGSILVGARFFDQLGLRKGDVVQLATVSPVSSDEQFTIVNREFVISGVFSSGENESDLGQVYIERSQLQDLVGTEQAFSQILVRLENYDADGPAVAADLRTSLANAGLIVGLPQEVRTWEDFRGNLLGAIKNERVLMAIMLSLVLMVAGFTIFAILSMMVTEKRRDIGILSALGATRSGILSTFLLVAFWDALIGSVFGATIGVIMALKIDPLERWLSGYTERWFGKQIFDRDVYLFDHIPAIVDPVAVAAFVTLAFVCTLGFAFFPAWRAARQNPLEGLRYE